MTKQSNEFFMKNHETWPVGFAPFLKVNTTNFSPSIGKGHGSNQNYD